MWPFQRHNRYHLYEVMYDNVMDIGVEEYSKNVTAQLLNLKLSKNDNENINVY
jgi:hypothetical protein